MTTHEFFTDKGWKHSTVNEPGRKSEIYCDPSGNIAFEFHGPKVLVWGWFDFEEGQRACEWLLVDEFINPGTFEALKERVLKIAA